MSDPISVLDAFIADVGAGRKPGANPAPEPAAEPETAGHHWQCPKATCDASGGPYKTPGAAKSARTRHAKTCTN